MRIAVAYDNGNVFQHFGRTEQFKVYETEEGKVVSSEVMGTNGVGHEALAGLLADHKIDALICGGMGQGAQDALSEAGIEVCAGASGDADAAVEAYLRGELVNTGVNCDHHDHHHGDGHGHDAADALDAENLCICLNRKTRGRLSEYITRELIMTENSLILHMTVVSLSNSYVPQA